MPSYPGDWVIMFGPFMMLWGFITTIFLVTLGPVMPIGGLVTAVLLVSMVLAVITNLAFFHWVNPRI